jgi:hypothetical protein
MGPSPWKLGAGQEVWAAAGAAGGMRTEVNTSKAISNGLVRSPIRFGLRNARPGRKGNRLNIVTPPSIAIKPSPAAGQCFAAA